MNLQTALTQLADKLDLNAAELINYASLDTYGGRNTGFNAWGIDADEGKLLYALVRALKPDTVLEIGTNEGASATHLLAAVHANQHGVVISYDTNPDAGGLINEKLRRRNWWYFRNEDAKTADLPHADFVFEDSDHSLAGATAVLERVKAVHPRIVIAHDVAMTTDYGDFHVREAFDAVFPDGFSIVLDGCERGLGVWINPDYTAPEVTPAPVQPKVAKKPAAKRTSAKKPAARK